MQLNKMDSSSLFSLMSNSSGELKKYLALAK